MSSYFSGDVSGISPRWTRKNWSGLYAVFSHLYRWETCSGALSGTISVSIMCNHLQFVFSGKSTKSSGLWGRKNPPPPAQASCNTNNSPSQPYWKLVVWSKGPSDFCFGRSWNGLTHYYQFITKCYSFQVICKIFHKCNSEIENWHCFSLKRWNSWNSSQVSETFFITLSVCYFVNCLHRLVFLLFFYSMLNY